MGALHWIADISNPDNNIGVGILIVDNQPREALALQKQLAFAGFKTEIATTGEGAVKILYRRAFTRHCAARSQLVGHRQQRGCNLH